MGVTVGETPNGDYTLDELNVTWDSGDYRLDKTLDQANSILFDVAVTETVGVVDTYTDYISFVMNIVESLGFTDSSKMTGSIELTDGFATNDAIALDAAKSFSETLSVSDTGSHAAQYVRAFNEVFGLADQHDKGIVSNHSVSLVVSESVAKGVDLSLVDSVGFADQFNRTVDFLRAYNESLSVGELCAKAATLPFDEAFGVADQNATFEFAKNVLRTLSIAEAMGRTSAFSLAINEGFTVAEATGKAVTLPIEEAFGLADQLLRYANTVVSDVLIGTGDIPESVFSQYIKRQSPTEHRDFREFIEGEYAYDEAVFKIMLNSMGNERALLDKLNITVDLPDIRDSGSAALTTNPAGLYIAFNRSFHVKPEIIIQLTGGTVIAIPDVISADKDGFTVLMKDTSGTVVAGNISWTAQGY